MELPLTTCEEGHVSGTGQQGRSVPAPNGATHAPLEEAGAKWVGQQGRWRARSTVGSASGADPQAVDRDDQGKMSADQVGD
jgi:hypothetical protein